MIGLWNKRSFFKGIGKLASRSVRQENSNITIDSLLKLMDSRSVYGVIKGTLNVELGRGMVRGMACDVSERF